MASSLPASAQFDTGRTSESQPPTTDHRSRPATQGAGAILQLFRDGRLRTRADLMHETGLSRSTVRIKVDALIAAGYLIEFDAETTGGRPAGRIGQNTRRGVILAIDLGASHATVALLDLGAVVLAEETVDLDIATGPVSVLDRVSQIGNRLLDRDAGGLPLMGVGVGVPGPVKHSTGQPIRPPIMPGWDGFDIPGELGTRFGAPVLVDNDVNLMALGEHSQYWPTERHLLFVKVATGIGSGIITEGRLTRGAIGTAGDLGHVVLPDAPAVACRCGNLGCLEAIAGGLALIQQMQAHDPTIADLRQLVAAVNGGDTHAIGLLREAGRSLGSVLCTCVSLLNPSVIVLGGLLSEAGEPLLAGVRETIYHRSIPLATADLRIVPAQTGILAGVLGAATMVTDRILSPTSVDTTLAART